MILKDALEMMRAMEIFKDEMSFKAKLRRKS